MASEIKYIFGLISDEKLAINIKQTLGFIFDIFLGAAILNIHTILADATDAVKLGTACVVCIIAIYRLKLLIKNNKKDETHT